MSHTSSRGSPPSIRIYDSATASRHGPYPIPLSSPSRHRPSHASTPAAPMPIPHPRDARPPPWAPPPLPPPLSVPGLKDDRSQSTHAPWEQGSLTPRNEGSFASAFGSSRPASSLLGAVRAQREPLADVDYSDATSKRRSYSTTTTDCDMADAPDASDDERANHSRRPSGISGRMPSEGQLGQRSSYDKQLLAKMGGPNSSGASGGLGGRGPTDSSFLSRTTQTPAASPSTLSPRQKLAGQLKPLAMPERRYNSIDSPMTRWTSAPSSSISPGTSSFRSPFDPALQSEGPAWQRRNSVSTPDTCDDGRSKRGSDDQGVFMDHDFAMEDSGMRELNLNERSPGGSDDAHHGSRVPLKRRAPSPPTESLREDRASSGNNLYHRRSAQAFSNRNSPGCSRYNPMHGSLSSVSSLGQKTGSYMSNISWNQSVASSMTSYSDRMSPSALSPSLETDYGSMSPYAVSQSLNPSPRSSVSKGPPHQRSFSESEHPHSRKMSTDSTAHSRQSSVSHRPGLYICECCPKKPKKFESLPELRAHEQEKQYQCQFCPNRFKNKNEAERHQNSLHLRRHSWSCAALTGVRAAFHPSSSPSSAGHISSTADVCGYCGEQFPNPPNWEQRSDHLNHVHKYGECNQQKKFFRADHFRQHLKHSHAGASGKWTNVLETACMKDEPTPTGPPPRAPKERMGSLSSISSMGSPVAMNGSPAMALPHPSSIPRVINEVQEES